MTNLKLKQLQNLVRSDKLLINEIKRLVGVGGEFEKIISLQKHLQYNKVQSDVLSLKECLFSGSNISIADEIIKIEKEITKIQEDDFNVCVYLNSTKRVFKKHSQVKKEHSQVKKELSIIKQFKNWKTPNLSFVNSDFRQGLELIDRENIPVILSKEKIVDLTKMPHLLVAGQTGSGKSVFLNVFISTVLYKMNPQDCKLVLIDPKRVEFSLFRNIPHLWKPVATQIDKIENVLTDLVEEMEIRYEELEKVGTRNITSYNQMVKDKKPYIVVVIDELADLMMVSAHGVETQVTRLAQLARAVGIHIVMATQRPVVEIMTGLIKANMPSRIAFKVASKQDSRVILDQNGAEVLKGAGDMIFMQGGKIERCQGLYISEEEIKIITKGNNNE